MAEEDIGQSRSGSDSRRTRSQAAPDWSAMDELILVNEIAAVEADCLKALSSYQKWKIIAENCAAQDVSRSLSQYRRKWDSLLQEYDSIKRWESRPRRDSYWSLKAERREELGLPWSYDHELFAAVGNLVRARENQSDTEPDSDGEAKDEMVDVAKESAVPVCKSVICQTTPIVLFSLHCWPKGKFTSQERYLHELIFMEFITIEGVSKLAFVISSDAGFTHFEVELNKTALLLSNYKASEGENHS